MRETAWGLGQERIYALSEILPYKSLKTGCHRIWCAHLVFTLWTLHHQFPVSPIFNGPIQWRSKSFRPWNPEQLPCTREERGRGDCTSGKEKGKRSLPSPCRGFLTPWGTCHAEWAPDPATALQFMGVSGSVESIICFPCRLKSWVRLSDDFVPK